jgi:hypothetical protein
MIISELARLQPAEIIAPSVTQKLMPFQIVPDEKIDLPIEILNNFLTKLNDLNPNSA